MSLGHSKLLARCIAVQIQKKVPGLKFKVASVDMDRTAGVGLFIGHVRHGLRINSRARRIDRSFVCRTAEILRSVRRPCRTLPRIRAA